MFIPRATSTIVSSLYAFSSFTFNNCGITGIVGPTLANCLSAYTGTSWVTDTNYFNVITQGFQLWTVPKSGSYLIDCIGACGGGANANFGAGARMQEVVTLTKGSKLQIIVGQMGSSSGGGCGGTLGGGGGGSFVMRETASYNNLVNNYANINQYAVVVAGGGGGSALNVFNAALGNATLSINANYGDGNLVNSGAGGAGSTFGAGGAGTGGCVTGGHGGGSLINDGAVSFSGDYGGKGIFRSSGTFMGYGGNGNNPSVYPNGGFGGGAAGNQYMGGGGGGFSGGGGGGITNCACSALYGGGGGGSFSVNRSSAPWYGSSQNNYNFTTHGSVTITFLG